MKNLYVLLALTLIFTGSVISAQTEAKFENVATAFEDYSNPYREVVYTHANKSIYIKGEMLGFSSYVLEKDTHRLSKSSKNLYCVITDSNDNIIKSKLVKVTNGFANNVFDIDSSFSSGYYTFKTYTNWMRNFDEKNAYIQSFRVIDPEKETRDETRRIDNELDVQFLPEGGHLIDQIKTNVGIIIKNELGFGVPNVNGTVYDKNDNVITHFKTNAMGIGRLELKPDMTNSFKAKLNYANRDFTFNLGPIKPQGVSITVNNFRNKEVFLMLSTNDKTLNLIKNKTYKLSIHNGKSIKVTDVNFEDNDVLVQFDPKNLYRGINIFTLFDDQNQPILERMVFNYQGMELSRLGTPSIGKIKDSVHISMRIDKQIKNLENVNISISALPKGTKSYNGHHNIISQTYLQPYVNGYIENATYYFSDTNEKKAFELDNLLITQGWSSYDWNAITNNEMKTNHVFEDGIVVQVNNNNPKDSNFLIHSMGEDDGFVASVDKDNNSFIQQGFFPTETENLTISALGNNGKLKVPNVYVQYAPSEIPDFRNNYDVLNPKEPLITEFTLNTYLTLDKPNLSKNVLDEVVIKAKTDRERKIQGFTNSAFYNVTDVFDENSPYKNLTLANYLISRGFRAYEQLGQLVVQIPQSTSFGASSSGVVFYVDDVRFTETDHLINFDMRTVDYIAINRYGMGNGLLDGISPVIRIYTKIGDQPTKPIKRYKAYKFPLSFSKSKKFYTPKYSSYNSDFYYSFGVIDWLPNCKIDENGYLTFKLSDLTSDVTLFIEGVTGDGRFLSTKKTLNLEDFN
ncbi:hypothetical protein [Winogradskyella luteola]|uniref:TonB-dependent receptor plug domain-containing protein n=1 Tax=Winogradskyella luteola TaxID=2828330 RepID=A0A9X1F959_9FLAO|nr:hypothetical protein [Winogradskyella luteola]MBV7268713.1 hypothetical protein [Winogradskyella luteola]